MIGLLPIVSIKIAAIKKLGGVTKKWIYIGNKWYATLEELSCIRDESYDKPPELDRAISLVFQRFSESSELESAELESNNFSNCVDVSYANLDSEGVFLFDKRISSPERLLIKVDYSYRNYDDLLIASLLAHEMMHARQFLNYLHTGTSKACIDQEVEAFIAQVKFMSFLNPEERSSLINRFYYNYEKNPALRGVEQLTYVVANAGRDCNKQEPCWANKVTASIREMVMNNPGYQDQCDL